MTYKELEENINYQSVEIKVKNSCGCCGKRKHPSSYHTKAIRIEPSTKRAIIKDESYEYSWINSVDYEIVKKKNM